MPPLLELCALCGPARYAKESAGPFFFETGSHTRPHAILELVVELRIAWV